MAQGAQLQRGLVVAEVRAPALEPQGQPLHRGLVDHLVVVHLAPGQPGAFHPAQGDERPPGEERLQRRGEPGTRRLHRGGRVVGKEQARGGAALHVGHRGDLERLQRERVEQRPPGGQELREGPGRLEPAQVHEIRRGRLQRRRRAHVHVFQPEPGEGREARVGPVDLEVGRLAHLGLQPALEPGRVEAGQHERGSGHHERDRHRDCEGEPFGPASPPAAGRRCPLLAGLHRRAEQTAKGEAEQDCSGGQVRSDFTA